MTPTATVELTVRIRPRALLFLARLLHSRTLLRRLRVDVFAGPQRIASKPLVELADV